MTEPKIQKTNCRACAKQTRHEVMHELVVETQEIFQNEKNTWQIIRCMGCHTISFRHQNEDYDDVEEQIDGSITHAISAKTYPRSIANHKGLQATYYLPALIKKIYEQTLKALGEQALVLASIGLRACIEATCNELKLSAASLEKRIDQLYKAGHVSNADKKRLHAIRFLGNDAAHEIKEPNQSDIRVALEIVEHLLNTVFILEQKASRLDLATETYDEFITLLEHCARRYESQNSISLAGLLGNHKRRVGSQIDLFETQIKEDIASSKLRFLTMGAVQNIAGKDVQLYEIQRDQLTEEIPFF